MDPQQKKAVSDACVRDFGIPLNKDARFDLNILYSS
jgi:hypothetical protein